MRLFLVDINPEVVSAWRDSFKPHPEVKILEADILKVAETCVVSPANSYGFMDGGIDAYYSAFFGPQAETALREYIAHTPEGELPVGASVLVRTGHARIPYMICAPTMRTPGPVPKTNAFYAMAAVLNATRRHANLLTAVYCPGLCTAIGAVPAEAAAEQMAFAYRKWSETHSG